MIRRAFLLSAAALPLCEPAGLAAVLSPFASMGHSATIGVLAVGVPGPKAFLSAFRKGLAKTGFIEGQNVEFVIQSAEGHASRLPELAADLVARKVDVIVAFQTPAVAAAKQATSDIPIVMDAGDPVGMGLVDSFARPGGNVTGMSAATAELAPKNLELLQQFVPSFHRVALFLNKTDPFRKPFLEHAQRGADRLGIGLIPVFIDGPADLQHAFATAVHDNPNAALIQPSLPIKRVAELTLTNRLPAASLTETFQAGGLMSYSADYAELWRHMALYVAKILKGAKPADLPVAQPTKFNFVINLKTANTLGLTIPPVILTMADQIIE
jgi:putative ABC transport system substrate-binding protein